MTAVLQKILIHIYVQSLVELICVAVLLGLIFSSLWHRFGGQRWWRPICGLLLGIWTGVVLWVTVFSRQRGSDSQIQWIPFITYWRVLTGESTELLRSAFMNALLFFPGGLAYAGLMIRGSQSSRTVIAVPLLFGLFSLGIELTQSTLRLGTLEIDDVLHNILGAAAGFAVFWVNANKQINNCLV